VNVLSPNQHNKVGRKAKRYWHCPTSCFTIDLVILIQLFIGQSNWVKT